MAEVTICCADVLAPERFPGELLCQIPGAYRRRAEAAGSAALAAEALSTGALLHRALGLGPDDALLLGKYGKPRLRAGLPHISIAHSAGRVALAVGDVELGVDLERPGLVRWAAARRLFTPEDNERLREAPPEAQPACFALLWTRLEARLKLEGVGFALEGATASPAERPVCYESFQTRGDWLTCATWTQARVRLEEVSLR